jgi:hypothetical protein
MIKGDIASPSLNWDFYSGAWLQAIAGVHAKVISSTLFDYNKEWDTDSLSYQTPYQVRKVSGDNQVAVAGLALPQPVKVQVTDNNSNPQANVPVYFVVTQGGGSVQDSIVLTNDSGYAATSWTLSSALGIQTVAAFARKADDKYVGAGPVEFAAVDSVPHCHIGESAFGGVVFDVDSTGLHGAVCALDDIGFTDWNTATSLAAALNTPGNSGWALPTYAQLLLLYQRTSAVYQNSSITPLESDCAAVNPVFMNCSYWSSTPNGSLYIWVVFFSSGVPFDNYGPTSNAKVRAVRSF